MNRLRTLNHVTIVSCIVSLLAIIPMPAQSSTKNVQLRIVNNAKAPIHYIVCIIRDGGKAYNNSSDKNPCKNAVTQEVTLPAGGARKFYTGNPIGVHVWMAGTQAAIYVENPAIGKPFFAISKDGDFIKQVGMVEGELVTRPAGSPIRFHREGDTTVKVMTIEVLP